MDKKEVIDDDESYADEMIEIEYMMATMGTEAKPKPKQENRPTTTCSDGALYEQRRTNDRKRVASLIVALGIEAELPLEFYEKLAKSRRAKILLRSVVNDEETASLIKKLYK